MAAKTETALLSFVRDYGDDGGCLVSLSALNLRLKTEDCSEVLSSVCKKGLADVIYTDRHGEPFVYITLSKKGHARLSEGKRRRRELTLKLVLAAISAFATFIFGKLLYLFFS